MPGRQLNKEDLIYITVRLAMGNPRAGNLQELPRRLRRLTVEGIWLELMRELELVVEERRELRARKAEQARAVREARRTQGRKW